MEKIKWKKFIALIICSTMLATIAVPTHTPVYAATKAGNTSGNLENGARAVLSGDWIYFAYNSIYKIKTDGTGFKKIMSKKNNGIYGLNVVDNWIYYVKTTYKNGKGYYRLYKIKTNGKGDKCLSTDQISPYGTVTVYNGWIYYNSGDTLYKMKTDGSKKMKLARAGFLESFCISGNWIYYIDGSKGICKVKTNGKSNKCIKEEKSLRSCQFSNGWIYYISGNVLYKMKADGTKNKKMLSNIMSYNVDNGWIYYSRYDKGFYKIKTNGTSKKTLSKDKSPVVINILDDKIYFINIVDHVWFYYTVKTNGKNLKEGWYY